MRGALSELEHLQELFIAQCDMSSLGPGDLSNLQVLETLTIQRGMERGEVRMDLKPRLLRGLDNLVELNLWPKNLGRRDAEVFDGLDNLKFLDLSVAGLERVPPNAFADLESLLGSVAQGKSR